MHRRVVARLLAFVGGTVALASQARAQTLPQRRIGMNRFAGRLHIDVGLQDLFWQKHRDRLRSGFVTRVLVRISIFAQDGAEPIANAFRRTEIVYDIWDEKFRVRREDGFGHGGVDGNEGKFREDVSEVRSEAEAIRLATALLRFPVVEVNRLTPGRGYRIAFRADLNPLSQELVADVRRSLTQPENRRGRLAGDSFFGSFVSIFVNPRIEDSERQLRFVSQMFTEPYR